MRKILGSFLVVFTLLTGCHDDDNAAVNHDADLADLILSVVSLNPAFDPATTDYTATVDNGTDGLTVTFNTLMPLATGTVNGVAVDSGATSTLIAHHHNHTPFHSS